MPGEQPRVSIAMIVKDEAGHLPDCLAAVAPLAPELCIVDTGSSDATTAIARHHGARVETMPWPGSFAAARNRSLEMCRAPWIAVLDADERIAQEDLPTLRALVDAAPACAYRFCTRTYTNEVHTSEFQAVTRDDPLARGYPGWFPSHKVRLFPNRPDVRFEGPVHELVEYALRAAGIPVENCPVPIHHYPLERPAARIQEKREMYLRLGLEKVQQGGGDARAYMELGNQFVELSAFEAAVAAYREALKRDASLATVWADIGGVLHLIGRSDEGQRALDIALKQDATIASAWRNLGVIHTARQRWNDAIACFRKALDLEPGWPDGHRYLATALAGAGRHDEAANAARMAVEANPRSTAAHELFLEQMTTLGRAEEANQVIEGIQKP